MKQSVQFFSRQEFLAHVAPFLGDWECAVISISDTPEELLEIRETVTNRFPQVPAAFLRFDDSEDPEECIDTRSAESLVSFIDENKGKDFFVHCYAGISRSAAVAKFICEYHGIPNPALEGYTLYNKVVLNKLRSCTGNMSVEEYFRQLEKEDRRGIKL